MKRKTCYIFGATILASGVFAASAMADIVGTAHDFSDEIWSEGEICLPCHTPHNAITEVVAAPLWNHELTQATYTMHSGEGIPRDEALDDRSILCMSCHDGTVALDSFGGKQGTQYMTGDEKLGTDLTDDHPIGVDGVYPDVPWFNPPENWEDDPHGFALRNMEIDGNVERVVSCTTCHEPHSRGGWEYMLRIDNGGSALCLTCHIK